MKEPETAAPLPGADAYRIASVATLTGIPAATIRIWERRYGVVSPERSAGNVRLYAQADIERLVLLKAAVDAGHAISTVAALTADQLRQRAPAAAHREAAGQIPRVAVYGDVLAGVLSAAWRHRADLQLLVHPLGDALAEPVKALAADVTIVEVPSLQQLSIESVRRLRKATQSSVMLVIYSIGGQKSLAGLDREGVIALPAPVSAAHLARLCLLHFSAAAAAPETPPPLSGIAPRRYDDAELAAINQMPNAVGCECPNHLSELLIRVNAFAQYNAQCEDRNADDAALHLLMASASARSRELLEYALARAIEHAALSGAGGDRR